MQPQHQRIEDGSLTDHYDQIDDLMIPRICTRASKEYTYITTPYDNENIVSTPGEAIAESYITAPGEAISESYITAPGEAISESYITAPGEAISESYIAAPGEAIADSYITVPGEAISESYIAAPGEVIADSYITVPGEAIAESYITAPGEAMIPDSYITAPSDLTPDYDDVVHVSVYYHNDVMNRERVHVSVKTKPNNMRNLLQQTEKYCNVVMQ